METEDGFINRWSRRKAAAQAEQQAGPDAEAEALQQEEASEAEALTDEDMPEVELLGESSDFSPFLSPGVSDELRKLALRKLFHLPQFNVRDGLNDYDEDFSTMKALTQEAAAQLRSWVKQQEESALDKVSDALEDNHQPETETAASQPGEGSSAEAEQLPHAAATKQQWNPCPDEVGDADLEA